MVQNVLNIGTALAPKRLSTACIARLLPYMVNIPSAVPYGAATPGFEAMTRLLLIVGYKLLEHTVICGREAIAMIPYFQGLIS